MAYLLSFSLCKSFIVRRLHINIVFYKGRKNEQKFQKKLFFLVNLQGSYHTLFGIFFLREKEIYLLREV